VYGWCQAVSADFAAMAALASRAQCVLGERKRLACGTGVVAWHARLAEGAEGISPRALRVPASPPISVWAKQRNRSSGRKGMSRGACRSATQGRARRVALWRLDGPGQLRPVGRWRLSGAAAQGWAGLGWVGRLAMQLAGTAAGGDRLARLRGLARAMGQKRLSFVV
jgi:hypothetical protein